MNDSDVSTKNGGFVTRVVLPLLQRLWPKFHNRITWTVVATGLALAASPWWAEVVIVVVDDIFQKKISIPDHPWIGITLVAIALLYHLAMSWTQGHSVAVENTDKSTDVVEHDRAVFQRQNSILSEGDMTEILDYIDKHHAVFSSQKTKLYLVNTFLWMHDGKFIDDQMQTASEEYCKALDELQNAIGKTFFTDDNYPSDSAEDDHRYVLYPSINKHRVGGLTKKQVQTFTEAEGNLRYRIDDLAEKYKKFRKASKSRLKC